nr:membrane protein insertion efficiency factor YidD [Motilibacter rhizosphaerae]
MSRLLLALLRGYSRWISPMSPPRCRYHPSCSSYAGEAIAVHGALRGTAYAAWRLLRCHPFTPGGYDPVPPPRSAQRSPRPSAGSGAEHVAEPAESVAESRRPA